MSHMRQSVLSGIRGHESANRGGDRLDVVHEKCLNLNLNLNLNSFLLIRSDGCRVGG